MPENQYARLRRPPVLLEQVTLTYPGADDPTLRGVSLHVGVGEFVSVVGASGSGKTTLLRLLTGQLKPTAGRATVAGLDLSSLPARKLPHLRRRIGVAFQDARLLPGRTALSNIAYALELTGVRRRDSIDRAAQVLHQIGIEHLAQKTPENMSGGEAQRVGIARAIAGRPQVLLADEPTGNLDPETAIGIIDTLASIADAGTSVMMVTHDANAIDRLHRRAIRIADGTITSDVEDATYFATGMIPTVTAETGPETGPGTGKVWARGRRTAR